jgi:hypothetical protein
MHIKNGITVALQVLPIFPLLEDHGKELYSVMEKLSERADLTPDLKQGCKAYMVQLQKRITVRPYLKHEDYAAVSPPCTLGYRADDRLLVLLLLLRKSLHLDLPRRKIVARLVLPRLLLLLVRNWIKRLYDRGSRSPR